MLFSIALLEKRLTRSCIALGIAGLLSTSAALAQEQENDVAAAAAAFSRAQEAELRGDHGRAAELYELADRIAPAAAALRSATRARLAAGQLAAAAGDAEELKRRYPTDPDSASLADQVLEQASKQFARLAATCTPSCTLIVDGLAVSTEMRQSHVVYVPPGQHTVVGRSSDGGTASERVESAAGQQLQIALAPSAAPAASAEPAAPAPAPAPEPVTTSPAPLTEPGRDTGGSSGMSPVVGLVLGGAAVAVGGVAVWSALDTSSAADDFKKNPTRQAFDDGESKDLRTNILIGTAAGLGVVSAAILLFATDWGGGDEAARTAPRFDVSASGDRAAVSVRGSF